MLTEARWQKEQELMRGVFPNFQPFTDGATFGFRGALRGPQSGLCYRVVLQAGTETYPQYPPEVYMHPRIGVCWIGPGEDRRLCMEKEWQPARSTFANTLLAVIRYLDENDPAASMPIERPRADDRGARPGGEASLARWLW